MLKNKKILLGFIALIVILTGINIAAKFYSLKTKTPNQPPINSTAGQQLLAVSLLINNGSDQLNFNEKVKNGSTVFDLLKQLSQEGKFILSYQTSSMGVFVKGIGQVENDNKNNKFWMFKVNNQLANVGASSYILKEGDKVEWDYGAVTDYKQS
jgi:hypothetical protein